MDSLSNTPLIQTRTVRTQLRQRSAFRRFLYHWFRRETVTRALKVAGVIGPVLILINQHDVLWRMEFSTHLLAKILLTFLVPYSVSSFSSARAYMDSESRDEP